MSTHAALAVRYNGKLSVTYVHSDGYPSWTGVEVVEFCRKMRDQNLWNAFKTNFKKLHKVKDDAKPVRKWREYYKDSHQHVSRGNDWYAYLRSFQGVETLESILSGRLLHWMELGEEQLKYEHYGYCINLDEHTFEFWYDGAVKFSSSLDSLNIGWKKG